MATLLQMGWWAAYDSRQLDADGVPLDDVDDPYLGAEGDRLTAVGELLQLDGVGRPYPYAAWAVSSTIPWPAFVAATYAARR